MKNLKFGVLAFGLLGIISMFIPSGGFKFFDFAALDAKMVYGPLAGFAVAAIFGILGVVKPPFGKVNAIAATAGFGVAFVLLKMWKIGDLFKGPFPIKLMVISVLAGLIISIIAVVKSEE